MGITSRSYPLTVPNQELNRLLLAAVVNQEFCELLMTDPKKALADGYDDQPFDLSAEEETLILSIRAVSLPDFASHLTNGHKGNGNGRDHNGHTRESEIPS